MKEDNKPHLEYQCPHCEHTFDDGRKLGGHVSRAHKSPLKEENVPKEEQKEEEKKIDEAEVAEEECSSVQSSSKKLIKKIPKKPREKKLRDTTCTRKVPVVRIRPTIKEVEKIEIYEEDWNDDEDAFIDWKNLKIKVKNLFSEVKL